MSYLIFDIETVPDFKVWTPGPKKPRAKTNPEDAFAPLYAHRPIAISYLALGDELEVQALGCLGTSQYGDDEKALLLAWNTWMNSMSAYTLVTYNGRRFDVPVLMLRSFRHALSVTWNTAAHRKRYHEDPHLDLLAAFTDEGAIGYGGFSLDTMCHVIGLAGKNGVDGSMIKGLYERKEIAKIEGYAACDAARTAFVLLRFLLSRGRIDAEKYRTAASALFTKCQEMNLTGVTFGADVSTLLEAA